MRIRAKKTFDDALVNERLKKLADLGKQPVADGSTGEERELRHQYILDVTRSLSASFGQIPAVLRAMSFAHPKKTEDERFGLFVSGIAVLFGLHPDDFIRHVVGRKQGQDLPVRVLSSDDPELN